jgi:hypothetical protein
VIELRDTVVVDTSPEAVWRWLESMPEHYLDWHPDHLGARWVTGGGPVPGAVLESREILHGRPHRMRMTLTQVEPGRRLRYRIFPGMGGEFLVEPADGGARFTAVLFMGVRARIVGPLLDRLLRRLLARRLEAIARHQAEEGANLAALLEGRPMPVTR